MRAIVGARAQQHQHQTTSPASTQASNVNQHGMRQQQQMAVSPTDLEALGLSFEMPSSGGPEGSPKLWPGLGADLVGVAASPSPGGPLRSPQGNSGGNSSNGTARGLPVDGSPRPQPNEQQPKASLLQKLLSE
ncbi:hypothetical protein J437_LFUL003827 [Ladona fulva]|uniref:Uncharacterized protein n=1 Tax=Ladona fulva TaxID=123851 RepID=A0A8K0KGW0_LADFU|nr:hypothetical protein J437_LFUL003827 [Ladona fulva]